MPPSEPLDERWKVVNDRVFRLVCLLALLTAGACTSARRAVLPPIPTQTPVLDQLARSWIYRPLFDRVDIPLPESVAGATDPRILSLYSPSVAQFQGRLVLAFGVALFCRPGGGVNVAKDSVVLAESLDNGQRWRFVKYLLEGDPQSCFENQAIWPAGRVYQANDPELFVRDELLEVVYTSTEWHQATRARGCGNVGLARVDASYTVIYRDNRYVDGRARCTAIKNGLSRPAPQWLSPTTLVLWMDSWGDIYHTPMPGLLRLGPVALTYFGKGADVNLPALSYRTQLLLPTGQFVGQERGGPDESWSAKRVFGSFPHQRAASVSAYLDRAACLPRFYYAGGSLARNEPGNPVTYWRYGIWVAEPAPGRTFDFDLCHVG